MTEASDGVQILTLDERCPALDLVEQGGTAVALVWPGTGAAQRSMHHIALDAGGRTQALRHQGEAVYYVKSGAGTVTDPADGSANDLIEGSMIHIEPDTGYQFHAGTGGMTLLGGPCPVDPALYAHL